MATAQLTEKKKVEREITLKLSILEAQCLCELFGELPTNDNTPGEIYCNIAKALERIGFSFAEPTLYIFDIAFDYADDSLDKIKKHIKNKYPDSESE